MFGYFYSEQDDTQCLGTESHLLDCALDVPEYFDSNCDHTEDAGAVCQGLMLLWIKQEVRPGYFGFGVWDTTTDGSLVHIGTAKIF
jgi:hypothetical protein